MKEVAQITQETVSVLMSDIRLNASQASVGGLNLDPNLTLLFRTSFGNEVQSACEELRSRDKLLTFHVLRSLISAFLYKSTLGEDISWQQELCHDIVLSQREDMTVPLLQLVNAFMSSSPEQLHHTCQQADLVFTQQLGGTIDKGPVPAVQFHIDKVSQQATDTLRPYLLKLVNLAALLSHGPVTGEKGLTNFHENITRVIEKCLRLKINLTGSSCTHTFFWPAAQEPIDLARMDCPFQQDMLLNKREETVVAHTLFPGIIISTAGGAEQVVVRPAEVMASTVVEQLHAAPPASPLSTR